MTYLEKRIAARKACAARYESTFRVPLLARLRELVERYPDVRPPNFISWEGHRFTNAATTRVMKNWIDCLSGTIK